MLLHKRHGTITEMTSNMSYFTIFFVLIHLMLELLQNQPSRSSISKIFQKNYHSTFKFSKSLTLILLPNVK